MEREIKNDSRNKIMNQHSFAVLPDDFPIVDSAIVLALKNRKRIEAERLVFEAENAKIVEINSLTQEDLIRNQANNKLYASKLINQIVVCHQKHIDNTSIYNCIECKQNFIAIKNVGLILSELPESERYFICKNCFDIAYEKFKDDTEIKPTDLTGWALEAFGPRRCLTTGRLILQDI